MGERRTGTLLLLIAAALVALVVPALASAKPKPQLPPVDTSKAGTCDFIAQPHSTLCMLPFPNDYFTRPDPSSPTGRRIDFENAGMPTNVLGQPIQAAPYNVSDGFSQGATILLKVPGIETVADVRATGAVPINHIGRYRRPNAPVVVIEAETGRRWPIWVEIDSNAADPSKRALEIHPAVNFDSGDRYIVALRNLRNAAGERIEAPTAFRYYRDRVHSKQPEVEARRKHFEGIFKSLKREGIDRDDLYLAWGFTVASDRNNYRRALAMRDAAFADLGDTDLSDLVPQGGAPSFQVLSVEENPNPGQIARRVKGTFQVPCYLFPTCAPFGSFQLGADGLPIRNPVPWIANFDCIVPVSVATGPPASGRPVVYGHGLFGQAGEVASAPQRTLAQEHRMVKCATDEIGMSQSDIPVAISALQDLSRFPALPDRLQQGLLNELYLGRLMISPSGFTSHPAFHQDGTPLSASVLDTDRLFYNGNSQGGIMGGALTALAPDFTRASLGVPAMNYSVLLPRSVDFDPFAQVFYPSYPNETARPLILGLIQMLWDRGEPNGYAHRITGDPLPDTPRHQALLNVAFGDHQVTIYQADVMARTIGAAAHRPVLYPGRWPDTDVLWGVPSIRDYPYTGSAIYYWDAGPVRPDPLNPEAVIGTEPPPYENVPNRSGQDPHGAPRATPAEQQLVSDFFDGAILQRDDCGGGPCFSIGFSGP
jgi:hypothetical protein